jgi:hypothetical protein
MNKTIKHEKTNVYCAKYEKTFCLRMLIPKNHQTKALLIKAMINASFSTVKIDSV